MPDFESLEQLTLTVAANNSLITRPHFKDAHVMKEMRERIKHVIYIAKENRTYDQILGDLPGTGNVAAADGPGDTQTQKGYIFGPWPVG